MSWESIMVAQVLVSSVMTLYTRRIAAKHQTVFIVFGVLAYGAIAADGWLYGFIGSGGRLTVPNPMGWFYIVIEGLAIPAAWLLQFQLVRYVGAANATVVTMFNYVAAAALGVIVLGDRLTLAFVSGAALVLMSAYIALTIRADTEHTRVVSLRRTVGLAVGASLLFAIGMLAEKMALTEVGVWRYAAYGWTMQWVGVVLLCALFGRHEFKHVTRQVVAHGIMLGVLSSIAGGLYVYALSLGTLSHTIIAAGGKLAVTALLAALLLHERNALVKRALACLLSAVGVWLVLQ